MNRYTRDEIIIRGLDEADVPTIDQKVRPNHVILPDSIAVRWLQDALDLFHNELPWASRIDQENISITSTGSVTAPTDFIVDLLNGVILTVQKARVYRQSYQKYLSLITQTPTGDRPYLYTTLGRVIKFAPAPTSTVQAVLHYYAMPLILGPSDVPDFPSDHLLVDYIRIKCMEYIRAAPTGSAYAYGREMCAQLKRSGLANEPEYDEIQLDRSRFLPTGTYHDHNAWMGTL